MLMRVAVGIHKEDIDAAIEVCILPYLVQFTSYFLPWILTCATPFCILIHPSTYTLKPTHSFTYSLMYVDTPFPAYSHISSPPPHMFTLHRPTTWCQSAGLLTPPQPSSMLEHAALSSPAASLSAWRKTALRLVHRKSTQSVSWPHSHKWGLGNKYTWCTRLGSLEENRVYPRQWPHTLLQKHSWKPGPILDPFFLKEGFMEQVWRITHSQGSSYHSFVSLSSQTLSHPNNIC